MEPNSSPAITPVTPAADEKPNYATANDLDFEMTAEAEQDFINEQLGITTTPTTPTIPAVEEPKTPEAPETPTAPITPETPAPVVAPEPVKPTEIETTIKTDDLWVEVEKLVVDDEGNQSTEKVKLVFNPDDPSTFIPDDFRFKNDKQLADILEAKSEMAALYKDRKGELDSKLDEVKQTQTAEEQRKAQVDAWDSEIYQLITAGLIDTPKVKAGDKDFLKDPGVQKIDEVFKFMTATNETLVKDGRQPISSFGLAFTMYQNDAARKAEAEAKAKDIADTKARGAMVGGSSAASTGVERPSYIAGSAANIWDVKIPD